MPILNELQRLWYGVVRDYEAISYQFTTTFLQATNVRKLQNPHALYHVCALHELDREMERQGLRFVRYADDFSIYCKTKQEARTAGNAIFLFLKHKLKLEINRDKSGIRRPVHFQILGYGFVPVYRSIRQKLVEIDGWLRNRLRYCIWTPMMISGEETR